MTPSAGGAEGGRLTAGEVLTGVITEDLARLLEHDPVVREGRDEEGIHQARVACRRLRSQLRSFDRALRTAAVADVMGELGWLGRLLGSVRDLDVLTERFEHASEEMGAGGRPELLRCLRIERQEQYAHLIVKMNGGRYRRLLATLGGIAEKPPVRRACAREPAVDVLLPEVASRWHDLERGVARLPRGARDEELHHVRILAKRARYAAEIAASFGPEDLVKLAKRVAKVQKVLGGLSDGFHAVMWLEDLKKDPSWGPGVGGDPLVLVERLLAREHGLLAELRTSWRDTFDRACEVAAGLGWSDAPPPPPRSSGGGGEEVIVRLQAVQFRP